MNIRNFQDILPKAIISHGIDCLDGKKVGTCFIKKNASLMHYQTLIWGATPYDVELKIDKASGDVVFQSCTCPFKGDVCEHVVALLFVIIKRDQRIQSENNEIMTKTKDDFDAIVAEAIRDLGGDANSTNPDTIQKAMEPVRILLSQAERAINDDIFAPGYQITQAVMEKLVPVLKTIDDPDGEIASQIEEAKHLQYLIADCTDDEGLKKEMYQCFVESATKDDFAGTEFVWDFANLAAILAVPGEEGTVQDLVTQLSNTGAEDDWQQKHRAAEVMFTFYQYHRSDDDVERFIEKNLEVANIRIRAVRAAASAKNHNRAIRLCEEGIRLSVHRKLQNEVNQWYRSLLDVYQYIGDRDKIIECSLYLFHHSKLELEYYHILRNECRGEKWKSLRQTLIDTQWKNQKWTELASIFNEENEHEDLMRTLEQARQITLISDYYAFLLPEYRDRLRTLGFSLVEDSLMNSDREHYHEAAQQLAQLRLFIKKAEIDDFKMKLVQKYPERKNLLDQLSASERLNAQSIDSR